MKHALIASLLLNLLAIFVACAFVYHRGGISFLREKLTGPNAVYTAFRQSPFYQTRVSAQSANTATGMDVFLGDSLTEYGSWNELVGCRAVNRGIAGDEILGVQSRLPSILATRPARIFLMIGLNDVLRGDSPETISKRYGELVDSIKPGNVEVYLQSILPTRKGEFGQAIVEVNRRIAKLADGRRVHYLDLYGYFQDADGLLDERYTMDGTHLNGAGYLLWRERLQAELR
jgi:lysophospholipase L1-like esterase